ncbi:MAG TPA: sigma-54 dependent transcriptional regulator, partial [Polyangiaceae bacterium]|nr:sigma-54 dependent transcriptional regulator [Polyangiaceae bacterium]
MTGARILLVEDDPAGRELATYNLEKAGYRVEAVETAELAIERFDRSVHDLVVTDLRLPVKSGMDVLAAVSANSDTPVIVITAYGDVDTAVAAMKSGAFDFVGKPFNRQHLLLVVRRALERRALSREVIALRRAAQGVERPIVAESDAMRRVLEMTDRVAASEASALITGETGTGKELLARRIHARSPRAEGPFVALSCAAVPAELLESELFGHERGSFTGATRARQGRFRSAHRGTLFLDEIGELPFALQGKLLRVLQEKVVDTVGADEARPVDVRLVAATNRDLNQMVMEGSFREDLLYRINVVELHIPPLAERPEDLDVLVQHFVAHFAQGRELAIPDELMEELRARPWPGNVRQLENACERLVILAPGDS